MTHTNFTPDLQKWLQKIAEIYISADIELSFCETLLLTANGHEEVITFHHIPELWQVGQREIDCDEVDFDGLPYTTALKASLPAPGLSPTEKAQSFIEKSKNTIHVNYDVFGLAYFMLTRSEEIDAPREILDVHQRYPAHESHAYKNGYLTRPIVDEWFHIIKQIVKETFTQTKLTEHKFQIIPSHDVDSPSRYRFKNTSGLAKTVARDVLKGLYPQSVYKAPLSKLSHSKNFSKFDPHNTFEWLMDVSDTHNLTSSFYFICGLTDKTKDADYTLEDPAICKLMTRIHTRGHKIGLHPSYKTFDHPDLIAEEAHALKAACKNLEIQQSAYGGRMHYLRWKTPTTFYGWEQAEMAYDSSLGYADHAGFRCGTCHEYPAFDAREGKMLSLKIRPLIAMETTLFNPDYMDIQDETEATNTFLALKSACHAVNGNFTLLWHNSNFLREKDRRIYESILSD